MSKNKKTLEYMDRSGGVRRMHVRRRTEAEEIFDSGGLVVVARHGAGGARIDTLPSNTDRLGAAWFYAAATLFRDVAEFLDEQQGGEA